MPHTSPPTSAPDAAQPRAAASLSPPDDLTTSPSHPSPSTLHSPPRAPSSDTLIDSILSDPEGLAKLRARLEVAHLLLELEHTKAVIDSLRDLREISSDKAHSVRDRRMAATAAIRALDPRQPRNLAPRQGPSASAGVSPLHSATSPPSLHSPLATPHSPTSPSSHPQPTTNDSPSPHSATSPLGHSATSSPTPADFTSINTLLSELVPALQRHTPADPSPLRNLLARIASPDYASLARFDGHDDLISHLEQTCPGLLGTRGIQPGKLTSFGPDNIVAVAPYTTPDSTRICEFYFARQPDHSWRLLVIMVRTEANESG